MILLTGDSHMGAIRLGAPDRPDVKYWPLGKGGNVATPFFVHDEKAKSVSTVVLGWRNRTFAKDTLTFDGAAALVGLSMPLNTSRILRDYSWDTHVPWHMQKHEAELPLSDAGVQALLAQDYRHALGFVAALQACDIKTVVIEAPHFFESNPRLNRARLDVFAYIDGLYRTTVREKLATLGVDVIDQPSDTLTEIGSTKPEFAHKDPDDHHHANPTYGAMMFEKFISYGAKFRFL